MDTLTSFKKIYNVEYSILNLRNQSLIVNGEIYRLDIGYFSFNIGYFFFF